MTEELTIEYRRLDEIARWPRNVKKHDIGALVESIRRYGMIDPPKLDRTLGALVYGNGRDEALEWMHAQGDDPPRGVKVDTDGMWLIPIKVGLDAATVQEAEASALDHNNLTLSGGDFTAYDMARLWGDGYTDILASLATADALPITVDGDALDGLLNREANGILDAGELWKGMPDFEQEDKTAYKSIIVHFANEDGYRAFAGLVEQKMTPQTRSIWYPELAHEPYKTNECADES